MPEEEFQFKRVPAVEKSINEINENDVRVRILGRVIDVQGGMLVIDDGTGKAEILTGGEATANINDTARVFARVIRLESGYQLQAEAVQSMNNLDIGLYKRVFGKKG